MCVCVMPKWLSMRAHLYPKLRVRVNLWLLVLFWPLQLISPLKSDLKVNSGDSQKGQGIAFMYIQQIFN